MKNNGAYLLRTEITKSHLNNHICQHRGMKTSTVTPSLYYVFNISLYCYDTIPSFIGNLWRVLLLGNHLKVTPLLPKITHYYLLWTTKNRSVRWLVDNLGVSVLEKEKCFSCRHENFDCFFFVCGNHWFSCRQISRHIQACVLCFEHV